MTDLHHPIQSLNQRGETPAQAKRRVSRHGIAALMAMLAPALLFPIAILFARGDPRYAQILPPSHAPWEFWVVAVCGVVATAGGIADWRFHRAGATAVGIAEHKSHLAALIGGGLPLFALMIAASMVREPRILLLPIVIIAIGTTVMICYDEFVFHRRRCALVETLMHRLLVFGNTAAWLAWMHWCFVRGAAHG